MWNFYIQLICKNWFEIDPHSHFKFSKWDFFHCLKFRLKNVRGGKNLITKFFHFFEKHVLFFETIIFYVALLSKSTSEISNFKTPFWTRQILSEWEWRRKFTWVHLKTFCYTQTPFRPRRVTRSSKSTSKIAGVLFWTRGIQRWVSDGEITWVYLKTFCHTQTPSQPLSAARPSEKSAAVDLESQMAALNETNSEASEWWWNYLGIFKSLLSHADTIPTSKCRSTELNPHLRSQSPFLNKRNCKASE